MESHLHLYSIVFSPLWNFMLFHIHCTCLWFYISRLAATQSTLEGRMLKVIMISTYKNNTPSHHYLFSLQLFKEVCVCVCVCIIECCTKGNGNGCCIIIIIIIYYFFITFFWCVRTVNVMYTVVVGDGWITTKKNYSISLLCIVRISLSLKKKKKKKKKNHWILLSWNWPYSLANCTAPPFNPYHTTSLPAGTAAADLLLTCWPAAQL